MRPGYSFKNERLKTDGSVDVDRGFTAHYQIEAADATAADTDGIHLAVASTGVQQEITTGITQPSVPRNITATAGGTATDIKAIQVTIEGTNFADEVITETLPAFTLDTAGTVSGSKAFKTVTKITIPAHDGLGATTAIGFGEVLGLPYKLAHNSVLFAHRNNIKEATAPTVNVSESAIESNTFDLNSALNGTKVDLYLVV
jgi:galactitol-specific phosphotransferase system IIB component